MNKTREIAILSFGSQLVRQPALFEVALDRIIGFEASHKGIAAVCPTPILLSSALTQRGLNAAITNTAVDSSFIESIIELGAIPIVEGDIHDAITLARKMGSKRIVSYSDSELLPSASVDDVQTLELAGPYGALPAINFEVKSSLDDVWYENRSLADIADTAGQLHSFEANSSSVISITVSPGYDLISIRAKTKNALPWDHVQMKLFERISQADISLEMLQCLGSELRFLVLAERAPALQSLAQEYDVCYKCVEHCAKLSVVGMSLYNTAGIFYRSLLCLAKSNIPLLHCADSNVVMTLVVSDHLAQSAETGLRQVLLPGTPISFDMALGAVRLNGRDVHLGARQAQLLRHLFHNVGRIVSTRELANFLFGAESKALEASVRVHMHNLRRKIELDPKRPRYIITVPDQGYVFVR